MTQSRTANYTVVDDHEIVRAGAAKLLSDRFEIVGEAGDIAEAIDVILDKEPDGVLIDVQLPSGSGASVVSGAKERGATAKFVALSVSADRSDVVAMLQAGVDGYLLKSTLGEKLPCSSLRIVSADREERSASASCVSRRAFRNERTCLPKSVAP